MGILLVKIRNVDTHIKAAGQDPIFQHYGALSHFLMEGDKKGQGFTIITLIIYCCLDAHIFKKLGSFIKVLQCTTAYHTVNGAQSNDCNNGTVMKNKTTFLPLEKPLEFA